MVVENPIAIIGLLLDIIGVGILFKWPPIITEEQISSLVAYEDHPSERIERLKRRRKLYAPLALILIILGFIFQIEQFIDLNSELNQGSVVDLENEDSMPIGLWIFLAIAVLLFVISRFNTELRKWLYMKSGWGYIHQLWKKDPWPEDKAKPSNLVIWIIAVYSALFGIAYQRYEINLQRLHSTVAIYGEQLDQPMSQSTLNSFIALQKQPIPWEPLFFRPDITKICFVQSIQVLWQNQISQSEIFTA
ncbi:hypothetical protein [Reichenbachiella sp.]|uniref:hypothetical protein n=1 Tax=Reichenbachiella sp. TaxID=2184521 RepID=UPI0032972F2B